MPTSCFPWRCAGATSDGKLHFCSLFLRSKLSAGPTSQCQPPPCNGDAPTPGAMVCQVCSFFLAPHTLSAGPTAQCPPPFMPQQCTSISSNSNSPFFHSFILFSSSGFISRPHVPHPIPL